VTVGLNTTCDIYTVTGSVNDYGEEIFTKAVGTTGAACRFIAGDLRDRERIEIVHGGHRTVATHKVLFEPDASVNALDWLKRSSDWYKVLSVGDIDMASHHLEVWVAHVQGVTGPG